MWFIARFMMIARDYLLNWYDKEARTLPWRVHAPERANPYHVWLSEVMLQQTTVATVIPYFLRFIERWPTLDSFAKASLDDLRVAWQGLGYYRRIENLYKGMRHVVEHYDGQLPENESELLKIPGIGPYTAAAIASIAFSKPTLPIDGNIKRVIARLEAIEDEGMQLIARVKEHLASFIHPSRSGDVAQALMDLGATICTPKKPKCEGCPLSASCKAFQINEVQNFPKKVLKKTNPDHYGIAFVLKDGEGQILLEKRPERGLLSGLVGVPGTPWRHAPWAFEEALKYQPVPAHWQKVPHHVTHVFTHFKLHLEVHIAQCHEELENAVHPDNFHTQPLATLYKKVLKTALEAF